MAPYVYVENGRVTAPPDRVTQDTGKYTWWRPGPTGADFVHERVTPNFFERAIGYVEEQAAADAPFFLYLALPSPHTPILPTPEWQGRSGLNPYADFVLMIDDYVGQLTAALDRHGIADRTLVIFTSDNGCSPEADFDLLRSQGHDPSAGFRGHKADIYEGGHRVPLLIRYPGRIAPGTVSARPVCTADFLATCADLTGYTLRDNEGEDSYSWLPLFDPGTADAYGRQTLVHHSVNGSFAIRRGDWKLILCPGSGGWSFPRPGRDTVALDTLPPVQLYHLADDPAERHNLATRYPERVAELRQLLIDEIRSGRSTPGAPQENEAGFRGWPQVEELGK